MSEYTTLLERVGDRVAPPSDAFERLTTLRRRKHRNRRFGAGALALLIAAAGISGAYVAFHQTKKRTLLVSVPNDFHAIFPALDSIEAGALQTALDKGLDPRLGSETAVAERFAIDILGWQPNRFRVQLDRPGMVRLSLLPSCWLDPGRDCPMSSFSVRLELAQLVRQGPGGAWFVTQAHSTDMQLQLDLGQVVKAGSTVTAKVRLPEGTPVLAGFGYLGPLCDLTAVREARVLHGRVTFPVATLKWSYPVDGVVFVGMTDDPVVDWNDPFMPYSCNRSPPKVNVPPGMNRGGPSGVSFSDLSAVPVRFIPAGAASTRYFVHLPAGPGAIDSKHLTILDAATNLPEGTLVSLYFFSKDEENPGTATVHDGMIPIRVVNQFCHLNGGRLTGSAWNIEVTVAPMYDISGDGPPPWVQKFSSQPDSVVAVLGQHFENLHGDQVTQVDGVNEIQISKDYQLPASTCTDRIVYLPGGDFRQVPVTPSP